jgi:hypothetical protein
MAESKERRHYKAVEPISKDEAIRVFEQGWVLLRDRSGNIIGKGKNVIVLSG